eukprot:TRINITY_DN5031_c0_g2_i1.p1 TRINITY_DN5031_c0_g2~~TRINITY_DN5031_c0_g2_i1.p1  ORF type:complete len:347 (+),score=30.02 TRINITY_DN5031_c0_g2_i1:58-1098(+)
MEAVVSTQSTGAQWTRPPINDPWDRLRILETRYPSTEADVNCQLTDAQLQQARFVAVGTLRAIISTTRDWNSFQAAMTPLFSSRASVVVANPIAGEYVGLELALEYISLISYNFNGGFVFFGASTPDPTSIRYYPSNSTLYFSADIDLVAFHCKQAPNLANGTGDCKISFPGRSALIVTFESCSAKIWRYLINYDDFLSTTAVQYATPMETCTTAVQACTGSNRIYSSIAECLGFMNTIPTVSCSGLFEGNSISCRFLHSKLAVWSPVHHCPHVSPQSAPCSDLTCLNYGQGLLCGNYSTTDVRFSHVQSANCTPVEPPTCTAVGFTGSLITHVLLLVCFVVAFGQ